jgi:ATP-dependent DNA ligase
MHEIKHDGFRILALRDAAGVRLYTRNRSLLRITRQGRLHGALGRGASTV